MHLPMVEEMSWTSLPSEQGSIALARDIVRAAATGMAARTVDDAVLLTSEVVTNAVRHGGDHIRLGTAVSRGCLTVRLHDDGPPFVPGKLELRPVEEASGRGLHMVELVSLGWGLCDDPGGAGKTVWFQVGEQPPDEGRGGARAAGAAGPSEGDT